MTQSNTEELVVQMRAAVREITVGLTTMKPDDRLSWAELAHAFEELGKVARQSARSNMEKKHYTAPRITDQALQLRITCCECPATADAPFVNERLVTSELYRSIGWILSVIGPADGPLLAPVCPVCAARLYPELLARVSQLLRGAN